MMLQWKITNRYEIGARWEDFDWEQFKACWPRAEGEKPQDAYYASCMDEGTVCRLSPEEVQSLLVLGIKLEPVPYSGTMISKLRDVGRRWDCGESPTQTDFELGAAVQISVPDMLLMQVTRVKVMEDLCTDALQEELDTGWRILAICPPNGQRRPDYILGKIAPSRKD